MEWFQNVRHSFIGQPHRKTEAFLYCFLFDVFLCVTAPLRESKFWLGGCLGWLCLRVTISCANKNLDVFHVLKSRSIIVS
jgi:hypothetical protein